MKIRKFEGQQMTEVLQEIKSVLGPDAVILSTREISRRQKVKGGGFLTMPIIEVTAAIEVRETALRPPVKKTPVFERALEAAVQGDIYKELQSIKDAVADISANTAEPLALPETKQKTVPIAEMHETWLEMKIMLKSMTEMRRQDSLFSKNSTLSALFEQLILSGVDTETAQHLVQSVEESLSEEDVWKPERVQHSIYDVIQRLTQVTGPFALRDDPTLKGPKVVALIGPTGVGKTTTAAKLGVTRLKRKQAVTLVSLDETESGGGDILIQHGDRYHIPTLKITSWKRLKQFVSGRKKGELILLDTAGRSHLKSKEILLLKQLMSVGFPLETHLVLSANTKGSDLSDMIDRFSIIPIYSLLFTKIDETLTYGPLFSTMGRKRKPLSYLTTGRRIPDDLELVTPKGFTDLILSRSG